MLEALTPDAPGNSSGLAINAAGDVAVGYSAEGPDSREYHVVMWRAADDWSFTDLGMLPSGTSPTGAAHGVSADGRTVVGRSGEGTNGKHEAFRWTASGGYQLLGFVDGGPGVALSYSSAEAVSADGSVVVGTARDPDGTGVAFSWTAETGMVPLGKLEGGSAEATATAINGNATVIVGMIDGPLGLEAFRWTEGKMVGLGDLSGGAFSSSAAGVSGDGARVVGVGTADSSPNGEAFFWDEQGGLRSLKEAMMERGFEDPLTIWTLQSANAISENGKVVVGCAKNSTLTSGTLQAYRVRLDP